MGSASKKQHGRKGSKLSRRVQRSQRDGYTTALLKQLSVGRTPSKRTTGAQKRKRAREAAQ